MDNNINFIFFAGIMSPCKDCGKREVGCHAKCEDYIAYKKKFEEEKEKAKIDEIKHTRTNLYPKFYHKKEDTK